MEVCPPRPRLIYVLSSFIFINITYCGHRRQFITSSIYTNTIVFFFRMLRLRVLALSLLLGCNHCNADPVARKQIVNISMYFWNFLLFLIVLLVLCEYLTLFSTFMLQTIFFIPLFSAKNNQTYLKTSRRRLSHSQEPASKPPLTRCRWPAPTSTPTRTGPSLLPMATRAPRCTFFVPGCFDTGTRSGWILPRQHRGTRRGSWVLWSRCSACRPSGDRSINTNQDGGDDDANDEDDNDHCNNGDDKPHIYTSKVLSTRPHTQKLQYYGAAKTPFSSKLDTLPTGQVRLMWKLLWCDHFSSFRFRIHWELLLNIGQRGWVE